MHPLNEQKISICRNINQLGQMRREKATKFQPLLTPAGESQFASGAQNSKALDQNYRRGRDEAAVRTLQPSN
jgi:hypothetical protein